MRIAIVENTAITHHGQVGVALHEAGTLVRQYRPFADGILPEPGSFDGLVVFGGEQSALSDDTHPYLPTLGALMARQAAAGVAVLGICLGAQVFARGLGAVNHLATAQEFGWCEVGLTDAGRTDPVLGGLPPAFPTFEWHSDTYSLPQGAAHLAQSPAAPMQAYRYGRAGYGMQFHFEASRAVVADWTRTFPDLVERMEPGWTAALPRRAAAAGVAADAHGLQMARAWLQLVQRGV
jgi:GMP synthase-like glutamine amidotransferase